MLDSGAKINCIRQDLIPSKYFEKSNQNLQTIEGRNLKVNHKVFKVQICIEKFCIKISFLLLKSLKQKVILRNLFLTYFKPFTVTTKEINTLDNQRIVFKSYYNSKKIPKIIHKIFCKNNI